MAEYGAEKKVSKYSSVVASVSVGQPTGVIMKVKYVFHKNLRRIQKFRVRHFNVRCHFDLD